MVLFPQNSSKKNILLYGDSLLFPLKFDEKDFHVDNLCVPGLTVQAALQDEEKEIGLSSLLMQPQENTSYQMLLVCLGTNDIAKGDLPSLHVIPALLLWLEAISEKHKEIFIGIFGFPFSNSGSRDLEYRLKKASKMKFLSFPFLEDHSKWLDEDGTHLNEAGLKHMRTAITSFINTHLRT